MFNPGKDWGPHMHQYYLELQATDVHTALGRLMDRIRVSGLMLVAIEVARSDRGHAVTVCIGADDAGAVEQLSNAIAKVVGTSLVGVGRSRTRAARTPHCEVAG